MKVKTLSFTFLLLLFLVVLFLISPVFADTILRKDGREVKGKIVGSNDQWLLVKTKYGEVPIDWGRIVKIIRDNGEELTPEELKAELAPKPEKKPEPEEKPEEKKKPAVRKKSTLTAGIDKNKPPEEQYKTLLDRADKIGDADAFVELAEWCQGMRMERNANFALQRALELDPNHRAAREMTGFVWAGGEWMLEEDAIEVGYACGKDGVWRKTGEKVKPVPEQKKVKRPKIEWEEEPQEKAAGKKREKHEIFRSGKGVPWSHRFTENSAHYTVNCNVSRRAAQVYMRVLEALYKEYSKTLSALNLTFRESCVVNIHRSYDEFLATANIKPGMSARYEYGRDRLTTFHGWFGKESHTTFHMLAHEATHNFQDLFIKGRTGAFPAWAIEGLAVVFESADIDADKAKVTLVGLADDRIERLQAAIKKGKHATLSRVLRTPKSGWISAHYDTAGSFTWWLISGSKDKKYKKLYEKYLLQLIEEAGKSKQAAKEFPGDNGSFALLVADSLKKTLDELEEEWEKYVLGLNTGE
jgi:hypothetical protein